VLHFTIELGLLNQQKIAEFLFNAPKEYGVAFDAALLKSNAVNELSFNLPDAALPGGPDSRMLAIALGKIGLFYQDDKNGVTGKKYGASLQKPEPPRVISDYAPGTWITQDSDKYLPSGWSTNEGPHRWSEGHAAKVEFKLKSVEPGRNVKLVIVPKMVLGPQHVEITVNNQKVATVLFDKPKEYAVKFDSSLLKPNAVNVISFNFPNAVTPGGADKRLLAIALGQMGLFY
jgi:hypothetical protein